MAEGVQDSKALLSDAAERYRNIGTQSTEGLAAVSQFVVSLETLLRQPAEEYAGHVTKAKGCIVTAEATYGAVEAGTQATNLQVRTALGEAVSDREVLVSAGKKLLIPYEEDDVMTRVGALVQEADTLPSVPVRHVMSTVTPLIERAHGVINATSSMPEQFIAVASLCERVNSSL